MFDSAEINACLNAPVRKKLSKTLQVSLGKSVAHYSGNTQQDKDDPTRGIEQSSEEVKAVLADVDVTQIPGENGASYPNNTSSSNVISSPINNIGPRKVPALGLRNDPRPSNAPGSSSTPIASKGPNIRNKKRAK